MGVLKGLDGVGKRERRCMPTHTNVTAMMKALKKDKVATTASSDGAVEMWIADDGKYHVRFCRYKNDVASHILKTLREVKAWLITWIPKCENYTP